MNADQFKSDISLAFAQSAYSALSHSPEKRGQQTVDDYAACLASDYAHLAKIVESKPELRETMEAEFARYREGYKQRTMDWLRSKSRCASWFITGPANFPVRRMEKRQNVEHKRLEELIEFRKRAMAAITKTLKSNGFRWSPTIGAWQAYRNGNSMQVASQMIGGLACA